MMDDLMELSCAVASIPISDGDEDCRQRLLLIIIIFSSFQFVRDDVVWRCQFLVKRYNISERRLIYWHKHIIFHLTKHVTLVVFVQLTGNIEARSSEEIRE